MVKMLRLCIFGKRKVVSVDCDTPNRSGMNSICICKVYISL